MSSFNNIPSTEDSDRAIAEQRQAAASPSASTQQQQPALLSGVTDQIGSLLDQAAPVTDKIGQAGDFIKDGLGQLSVNTINPVGSSVSGITDLINQGAEALGLEVPELYGNKVTDLASDAANLDSIAGGQIADSINGLANLPKDLIAGGLDGLGVIEIEDSKIPWSAQYDMGAYDLSLVDAKTEVGDMAATMLKFAAVGTATGGAGLIAQFGADGLLDFLEAPGTENISNMYEDNFGSNFITNVLAQDEDDHHLTRRFRNVLEGAVPGIGVVSARQGVKAIKALQRAIKGGKTVEEAADIAADVLRQAPEDDVVTRTARAENNVNSGRPDGTKPPTLDPQDRVSQVYKADVNRSAATFWDNPRAGGGDSLVDEIDIKNIKTEQGLKDFIAEKIPGVDVDDISRRLSKQTPDHIKGTWESLADFANSGEFDALNPLRYSTNFDKMLGAEAGGVVVLDTLVKSVADRMSILANEAAQLIDLDAPFKVQAGQILDRAEALVVAKKESSQFASKGLESFKNVPPQLKRAVEADRKKIDALFSELRSGLDSSDPVDVLKFKKQFSKLAMGLGASKGDPRLQMDVLEGVARVGLSRTQSVFINSILSGPLTHARNIAGNAVALAERPLSRALGGGGIKSFYAFNGIHKSILEGLAVARTSFGSSTSITTNTNKVTDYVLQDRRVIENAINNAQSKGTKQVASVALKAFDLTNNPWFNWPGKALQAGDDFTKSILARMELRYQAGIEADAFAKGIENPGDIAKLREDTYQRLIKEKLSPKGAIIDADLVDVADAASFQRPLEGWVAELGSSIQGAPGGRFVMPFYKTPVNITRYAAQISPLAPLSSEWRKTIQFGTPDEKAIMRGRMALGSVVTASAAALASQGLATGYGPPPGPERDIWLRTHEPMSVLIGGKWVSYQALPGLSLVISATADMTQLVGKLSENDADYVLGALPFFVANAITSQPMFQGVINMSDMFDPSGWSPEGIIESAGEFGNNLGGGANLRRTFENAMRTNMADYKDWANELVSKLTAGFAGEVVERIDVLTGKGMTTKYSNPLNLINPFTVVGKDRSPLLESLDAVDFPIKLAVPDRVSGVPLTPDEKNFLGKAIYSDGDFTKGLQAVLASRKFENQYNAWQATRGTGEQIPKEESEWYKSLARVQSKYQRQALNNLRNSNDPISANYRETFADRAAKASTGNGGNLSPDQVSALREVNAIARWGSSK